MRSNSVIATESFSRFWRWARSMSARRYKSYAAAYDLYLRADMLQRDRDRIVLSILALGEKHVGAQVQIVRRGVAGQWGPGMRPLPSAPETDADQQCQRSCCREAHAECELRSPALP